jgi:hypothetical protein
MARFGIEVAFALRAQCGRDARRPSEELVATLGGFRIVRLRNMDYRLAACLVEKGRF